MSECGCDYVTVDVCVEGPQLVLTTVMPFCKGFQIANLIKDPQSSEPPECGADNKLH